MDLAKKTERQAFTRRLTTSLREAGWADISSAAMAREFNARTPHQNVVITMHAARKWLNGEALPTQARMVVLARWLQVPPAWLQFGIENSVSPANDGDGEDQTLLTDLRLLNSEQMELVRGLITSLQRHCTSR